MPQSPERVLVVTAHPDDVDFAAAGTVATLTGQGVAVSYCVVTDGDAGGFDPAVARALIPSIRRAEQCEAARVVGVTDIHWLGFPDGRVEPDLELRRAISRVIRIVRPQRVITQNPERNWDSIYGSHPDHMAAGEATLRAVYPDARNPFAFPELAAEGLEAHAAQEVWVMGGPAADTYVDVTDQLPLKLAALRCHVSQEPDRDDRLEPLLQRWMTGTATAGGLAPGRLAEGFRRLDTQ
jgi:LmbE family N-acetylglucosaminyl deacetylase